DGRRGVVRIEDDADDVIEVRGAQRRGAVGGRRGGAHLPSLVAEVRADGGVDGVEVGLQLRGGDLGDEALGGAGDAVGDVVRLAEAGQVLDAAARLGGEQDATGAGDVHASGPNGVGVLPVLYGGGLRSGRRSGLLLKTL